MGPRTMRCNIGNVRHCRHAIADAGWCLLAAVTLADARMVKTAERPDMSFCYSGCN